MAGPNAPIAGAPFDSALITTDTSPLTANVSGVAGGVTAVGGFFGNTSVPTDSMTLTLMGTSGVLDQRTFLAPDMGLGEPRKFFGWVVAGDTVQSVTHETGNYEGLDDFQYGNIQNNTTVVEAVYSNPASPVGPISLGLSSLPDTIPAHFILNGLASGATTFGLGDVLFAQLSVGDGTWTTSDLTSFSMTVDALGEVTDLTYEMGLINTPTVTNGGILNSSFSLTIQGTDIASGQDFEYLHQESMQTLTVIPEPSSILLATLALAGLLAYGHGRRRV